ncbi:MAG: iron-containing alcohol dehydrogenase [Peptococcaceae bacterium]
MLNFEFYSPTKVIFGKGVESNVGEEVKIWGGSRVLVHFGGSSAKKSGLLDRIFTSLAEAGLTYFELGGVVPNPRLGLIREGVSLCKAENIDFILAVGGGSVIDSAKAIGMSIANDCDAWDIYAKKVTPVRCLPIGTVVTIAAAGSETSQSSVITNEDGWLKRGAGCQVSRPKFAIMNPELTYTLPAYQTACGIVDILMHTMERYFTTVKNVELIDRISEGLLKTVINNGIIVMKDPANYAARAEILWAGSLSHNDLTGTGRTRDFASHQMEHELSGMFDVAHGAGLAAIWGSWARFVYKTDVSKFVQYAVRVWNCELDFQNPEATALAGIAKTEEYFKSIGMPVTIKELGIANLTDEQIEELAEKCTFFGKRKIGAFMELDKDEIMQIFQMAR